MPLYEPNVPTRYTALLQDFLRADGPGMGDALCEAGVDAQGLRDADAVLSFAQFDTLLTALRRATGRSDIGFELGRRITRETHGALGQALAQCGNAAEMLQLAARYSRLMTPSFTLRYVPHRDHAELIWRPAAGMSAETLRLFYEIHVVSTYTILGDAFGEQLRAYDCWLPLPPPAHAHRYRELPKLRVHFGESPLPQVRTVLDAALLELPLRARDESVAPIAGDELSRLQSGVGQARRWSDWVRLMLREADGCQPSQAQLAGLLNLSAHSLARRLADERCSYRELATEIRHQRACAMLGDPRCSIARIAHRLGYRSAANFSHAFRGIEGQSPRAYRQRLASAAR